VIVGPGDDAGVYSLGGNTLVETVDVIAPVVDDPFTFGAISANNSLSDVYAMGGRPLSALAIMGFPSCDYDAAVAREILRGAVHSLARAGAVLIGGHSFDDPELKFGLSVTGVIEGGHVLRVSGAEEGDLVVLTKPLGIGILTTALKGGKVDETEISQAVGWMLTLNDASSQLAVKAGATACTDVTGFGLLGHAFNMVRGSGLDLVIESARVPVMDRVRDMISRGIVPEGAYHNLRFLGGKVLFSQNVSEEQKLVLADPQTSGGLLIALKEEGARMFQESPGFCARIGMIVKGSGRLVVR
jgi:selenide,water dikinase